VSLTELCARVVSSVLTVPLLSSQLSWFPFILYDTDWMGREIYHGDPKGTTAQIAAFDEGVRVGSFGLLLNSVRLLAPLLHL
jgi:hypothetical protein